VRSAPRTAQAVRGQKLPWTAETRMVVGLVQGSSLIAQKCTRENVLKGKNFPSDLRNWLDMLDTLDRASIYAGSLGPRVLSEVGLNYANMDG
jgi:hypothetical protein